VTPSRFLSYDLQKRRRGLGPPFFRWAFRTRHFILFFLHVCLRGSFFRAYMSWAWDWPYFSLYEEHPPPRLGLFAILHRRCSLLPPLGWKQRWMILGSFECFASTKCGAPRGFICSPVRATHSTRDRTCIFFFGFAVVRWPIFAFLEKGPGPKNFLITICLTFGSFGEVPSLPSPVCISHKFYKIYLFAETPT